MRAYLGNAAFIQNQDTIGLEDGRKPVRDDDGGAVLHQAIERLLYQGFAFGIERRCRFVEKQDRGVLQQRSGNGDPLTLAARKGDAALAHGRVEALLKPVDEFPRLGSLGGGDHILPTRAGGAEGNVVVNGRGEDRHVLGHDGDA